MELALLVVVVNLLKHFQREFLEFLRRFNSWFFIFAALDLGAFAAFDAAFFERVEV